MPKSALPVYLQNDANWKGTDWDTWYQRWMIPLKGWFAYGPHATEWWAKWREWPKTLFFIRSKQGVTRLESETIVRDSSWEDYATTDRIFNWNWWVQIPNTGVFTLGYLSRIQYYTRWSFQIQWPFLIAAHFYPNAADVPEYGKPRPDTDGKVWFGYIGAHRDADKVYWFPSTFLGRTWK